MLYDSTGILRYSNEVSHRLVLEIDREIVRYYRSLIPKHFSTNLPRYVPHITVVRPEKEVPINLEFWGKYEGLEVPFLYDNQIQCGKVYYWLNAFCKKLEEIRLELGLPVISQYGQPPEGFTRVFHITICNKKTS
jgi:hypothetical protein